MMRRTICTLIGCTIISFNLHAEEKNNIDNSALSQCQSEVNGTKRLACYDKLLPPESSKTADTQTTDVGNWQISTQTSPVDDSKNVFLSLSSNESITSNFGEHLTPSLYITCREKKTEVYINWDVYLGLQETTMLHRLDKQKAETRRWSISTDTKSVFYQGKPIDFIKSLVKSNQMYAKITPYNENTVAVTFNLVGLSNAIEPLQSACGWK